MALITFTRAWRHFQPDRTQEINDGVADVLVQRGIAVYVTQDSDVDGGDEPAAATTTVARKRDRRDRNT